MKISQIALLVLSKQTQTLAPFSSGNTPTSSPYPPHKPAQPQQEGLYSHLTGLITTPQREAYGAPSFVCSYCVNIETRND